MSENAKNKEQNLIPKLRFITVSVRDLELTDIVDKPPLNDISCYLTSFTEDADSQVKSNKCFDLLILTDPQNEAKFRLLQQERQFLKVQLKTLSKQRIIGSVTLNLQVFADSSCLSVDQWVNLAVECSESMNDGSARIKLRFGISENEEKQTKQKTKENNKNNLESKDQGASERIDTDGLRLEMESFRSDQQTTIQPCVNFQVVEKKKSQEKQEQPQQFARQDFIPILTKEQFETNPGQNIANIESRLVLTPERQRLVENSMMFQNKFHELIDKLMETKNQSLILGVTKQLNESQRKDFEKNNLTDILKRLNESQNYIECDDEDDEEDAQARADGINLSLSGIQQISKRFMKNSPRGDNHNNNNNKNRKKVDLEIEIAALRLELDRNKEFEQLAKDMKAQVFNAERNNEALLNQYNKAVDNYQKYFAEINDENLELKKKVAALEKQQIKQGSSEDIQTEKVQDVLRELDNNNNGQVVCQNCLCGKDLLEKQEFKEGDEETMLSRHRQEIQQYSQMLVEAQNEAVQLQAKLQEVMREQEENNKNKKQNEQDGQIGQGNNCQVGGNSSSSSKLNADDQMYFEKLLKEKVVRITQLEGEKAQLDFMLQKQDKNVQNTENVVKQLQEELSALKLTQNTNNIQTNTANNDNGLKAKMQEIENENQQLKIQIQESEQLRITLEDHLLKTKQNFQKRLDESNNRNYQVKQNCDKESEFVDEITAMRENQKKYANKEIQLLDSIRSMTYDNNQLKMQFASLSEKYNILEFDAREVEQLRIQFRNIKDEKEKSNADLYSVTEDLLRKTAESISQQQLITSMSHEIRRLERLVEEFKNQNKQTNNSLYSNYAIHAMNQGLSNTNNNNNIDNSKKQGIESNHQQVNYLHKHDDVDQRIKEFEEQSKCVIPFIKVDEGIYEFGTKRIVVRLLKGRLVCRVGGGFMPIEEFLQIYTIQELVKIRQVENNEQQGNNSKNGQSHGDNRNNFDQQQKQDQQTQQNDNLKQDSTLSQQQQEQLQGSQYQKPLLLSSKIANPGQSSPKKELLELSKEESTISNTNNNNNNPNQVSQNIQQLHQFNQQATLSQPQSRGYYQQLQNINSIRITSQQKWIQQAFPHSNNQSVYDQSPNVKLENIKAPLETFHELDSLPQNYSFKNKQQNGIFSNQDSGVSSSSILNLGLKNNYSRNLPSSSVDLASQNTSINSQFGNNHLQSQHNLSINNNNNINNPNVIQNQNNYIISSNNNNRISSQPQRPFVLGGQQPKQQQPTQLQAQMVSPQILMQQKQSSFSGTYSIRVTPQKRSTFNAALQDIQTPLGCGSQRVTPTKNSENIDLKQIKGGAYTQPKRASNIDNLSPFSNHVNHVPLSASKININAFGCEMTRL